MDASGSVALPVTVLRNTNPTRTWQPETSLSCKVRAAAAWVCPSRGCTSGVAKPNSVPEASGFAKAGFTKAAFASAAFPSATFAKAGVAKAAGCGSNCCHCGKDACISRASSCEHAA